MFDAALRSRQFGSRPQPHCFAAASVACIGRSHHHAAASPSSSCFPSVNLPSVHQFRVVSPPVGTTPAAEHPLSAARSTPRATMQTFRCERVKNLESPGPSSASNHHDDQLTRTPHAARELHNTKTSKTQTKDTRKQRQMRQGHNKEREQRLDKAKRKEQRTEEAREKRDGERKMSKHVYKFFQ